jgi:uncharacterized membrane protein
LFELANAIFEGDFDKAESIIKDFVDAIASIDFTKVFGRVTDAVDGIIKKIQSAFNDSTSKGIVDQIFGVLGGFVSFAVNRVAGFITDVISELRGTRTSNVLAGFLVDGLSALVAFTAQATQAIANFLGGLDYARLINEIVGSLISVSQTLTAGIIDLVNSINWSEVTSRFTELFADALSSSVGQAVGDIAGVAIGGPSAIPALAADEIPDTQTTTTTDTSTGQFTTTNNASGSPVQLDGFEVSKRTGRYDHDTVVNRGGATGL